MMASPKEFWEWFIKNEAKFYFLNQIEDDEERERVLDVFQKKLHQYCPHLYFEIGGLPNADQELIITSEGNIDFFDNVTCLVDKAPNISNWKIVAFKQPHNGNYVFENKKVKISTKEIWFLPLSNEQKPNMLGLRIGIPKFQKEIKEDYLNAMHKVLNTKLGEKNYSLYISFVDVVDLPSNPKQNGFIEFVDLNNYMQWYLSKNREVS